MFCLFQLQSTTYVPSSSSVTSTYVITGAQPSNQGAYTCLATNGYSYATADIGLLVTPAMVQSAADYWYIFMIIGLLIIFVIIAIIAFYCHWKNVGESYPGYYVPCLYNATNKPMMILIR